MGERGAVTEALVALAGGHDPAGLAQRICQVYVDGLDIDGAAISLLTASTSRETLCASDATAELLEDLQFTLNEGPCMVAASSGRAVLVPDLHHSAEAARWPMFAAAVAEQTQVATLLALPLQWGTVNLGVLDLYRNTPGGLIESQTRDALAAADTAALLLLGQRTDPTHPGPDTDGDNTSDAAGDDAGGDDAGGDDPDGGGWLDQALGHRAEIHQATGMVLAQLGVSATDALARLRAHAFVHGLLLIDVAADVVARRLVFTPDTF